MTLPPAGDEEAAYTQAIAKRADDILAALKISDSPAADRLRQAVVGGYRELRSWHDANDDRLRQLGYRPDAETAVERLGSSAVLEIERVLWSLQDSHNRSVARLRADLSPEQVDVVKDKLTYGKLDVTYNAYLDIFPKLTDTQKTYIREELVQAREAVIDGGSNEENRRSSSSTRIAVRPITRPRAVTWTKPTAIGARPRNAGPLQQTAAARKLWPADAGQQIQRP